MRCKSPPRTVLKKFCQVKSQWIWHPLGPRSVVQPTTMTKESSLCPVPRHITCGYREWPNIVIIRRGHWLWLPNIISIFNGMYSSTLLKCQTNIMLFRWALSLWVVTTLNRHEWYLDLSTLNPSWHTQEQIWTLWCWWCLGQITDYSNKVDSSTKYCNSHNSTSKDRVCTRWWPILTHKWFDWVCGASIWARNNQWLEFVSSQCWKHPRNCVASCALLWWGQHLFYVYPSTNESHDATICSVRDAA